MKVKLTNRVVFDLNTENMTAIPYETFKTLVVPPQQVEDTSEYDEVRCFKTMADYAAAVASKEMIIADPASPVYVNDKGQIFIKLADITVNCDKALRNEEN